MHGPVYIIKILFSVLGWAIRVPHAASFPADCDVTSLPFHGGDNSAPAASASCVWPQFAEPLLALVCLQVVVELLTLQWSRIHLDASSSLNGKGSYLGLAALWSIEAVICTTEREYYSYFQTNTPHRTIRHLFYMKENKSEHWYHRCDLSTETQSFFNINSF